MTEDKRSDRRVKRTRRLLKDALFALILEKGYDAVTIEEITERADLGRTTFYLHYRDKEELLLESIEVIADDLVQRIQELPQAQMEITAENLSRLDRRAFGPINLIFQHAEEHADLYRIILRGEGATQARKRLLEIINTYVHIFFTTRIHSKPELPVQVISNYFAGSLLSFVTWWLENDMPYSAEEMSLMFRRMFFLGGASMLGLLNPPVQLNPLPSTSDSKEDRQSK